MSNNWGYSAENDQSSGYWSKLFRLAREGRRQSPVDISPEKAVPPPPPIAIEEEDKGSDVEGDPYESTEMSSDCQPFVPPLKPLVFDYDPETPVRFFNAGHTFLLDYDGGKGEGNTLKGGPLEGVYTLIQGHCHWGASDNDGSEHTINGKKYPAEMHFVFWARDKYGSYKEAIKHEDGQAAVSILLELSEKPNGLLRQLNFDAINEGESTEGKLHVGEVFEHSVFLHGSMVNPRMTLPADVNRYWTYHGSMTTPPCHESVIWLVMADVGDISEKQLTSLRQLRGHHGQICCNARPTMPLHDRVVRASFTP